MKKRPLILIVDDEEHICVSLASILNTYGYDTASHQSVDALLKALDTGRPACILLDVRMPNIDGLKAQRLLAGRSETPPVIMMSGHGDIAMAVSALKNGAFDFIEKPIDDEKLAAAIEKAIAADADKAEIAARFAALSPREKAVASLVAQGYSSHAIAAELKISSRTVDHHRASVLAKMQATSLAQLISLLMKVATHEA